MKHSNILTELIFTLCILFYVFALAVASFGYKVDARLFPQIIMAPTILFLILRIASMLNPNLGSVFEPESFVQEKLEVKPKEQIQSEKKSGVKKEKGAILSITFLMLGFLILGALPAMVLFFFLFMKLYGRKSLLTSAAFTLSASVLLYVLFVLILQTSLYAGLLDLGYRL